MQQRDETLKKGKKKRHQFKRITVALEKGDYEKVEQLATDRYPPLSIQYIIQYAVHSLLELSGKPGFAKHLADPFNRNTEEQ